MYHMLACIHACASFLMQLPMGPGTTCELLSWIWYAHCGTITHHMCCAFHIAGPCPKHQVGLGWVFSWLSDCIKLVWAWRASAGAGAGAF